MELINTTNDEWQYLEQDRRHAKQDRRLLRKQDMQENKLIYSGPERRSPGYDRRHRDKG